MKFKLKTGEKEEDREIYFFVKSFFNLRRKNSTMEKKFHLQYAVFQNIQNFPRLSAIAQGNQRFYVTFVFDPLHLPRIASEKHPVHLPGCA